MLTATLNESVLSVSLLTATVTATFEFTTPKAGARLFTAISLYGV